MKAIKRPCSIRIGFWALGAALIILCTLLLVSIFVVILELPPTAELIAWKRAIALLYQNALLPIIVFLAEIIKSLFPWPAIVLLLLTVFLKAPDKVVRVLSMIGKLELPGGLKYEGRGIPPEIFRKELGEAEKAVERANKEIKEAYDSARVYAAQLRDRYDIGRLASNLAAEVAKKIGEGCPDDYRMTLYIRDFVFVDRLYQFVEYYNKGGQPISQDRAGRTFSIRYGIIGRVWRSGVAEVEGELISPEDQEQMRRMEQNPDNDEELERFIARRWGLTLEEAAHIRAYNSYGAIRLDRGGRSLGVLYFDSKSRSAFGDGDEVRDRIERLLRGSEIMNKLMEMNRDITPWSARIQVFRNS